MIFSDEELNDLEKEINRQKESSVSAEMILFTPACISSLIADLKQARREKKELEQALELLNYPEMPADNHYFENLIEIVKQILISKIKIDKIEGYGPDGMKAEVSIDNQWVGSWNFEQAGPKDSLPYWVKKINEGNFEC